MHKSVRLRYIGSFLLVVLIPIIVFSTLFYTYNIYNSEQKILNSRLASFNQAVTQVNYMMNDISNIALHISSSLDEIEQKDDSGNISINSSAIISLLSNYEKSLKLDLQMCFYIRGDKYIYLSDGKYDYSSFENSAPNNVDMVMTNFFSRLNTLITPSIFDFKYNFTDLSSKSSLVAYLFPLPYLSARPDSSVVFLINGSHFKNIFENTLGSFNGNLYILNNDMNIIFKSESPNDNHAKLSLQNILKIKGTGILKQTVNNHELVLLRSVSDDNGMTYVVSMEKNEFFSQLINDRRMLTLLVVSLLILCAVVAILMAYYNYNPIKALLSDITGKDFVNTNTNEFDIIKAIYNDKLEQNQKLFMQINSQNSIVRSQSLLKLVGGKFKDEEELEYYLQCAKLKFTYNSFFTIVLNLYSTINKQKLIEEILTVCKHISFPQADIYVTEMITAEALSFLVNCDLPDGNTDDIRYSIAKSLYEYLKANSFENVMLGVGNVYTDPLKTNLSYIEACAALQNVIPGGNEYIHLYAKNDNKHHQDFSISVMQHSLLIESIKNGNQNIALSAFEDILRTITETCQSFIIMQLHCFEVLNMLLKLFSKYDVKIDFDIHNLHSVTFQTMAEFRELGNKIIISGCAEIANKMEKTDTQIKNRVLTYIHDNYKNVDFSLDAIANALNITKSRINTILKVDIGQSFGQYVSTLRTDEVKRQLIETDKKVSTIVNDVGYLDVSNFVRKFKTMEGVTPGQYRELNRKKQANS